MNLDTKGSAMGLAVSWRQTRKGRVIERCGECVSVRVCR